MCAHTTEYRASASAKNLVFGDGAGRNKGRLSGVRKKLFEEQGWACACCLHRLEACCRLVARC